MARCWPTLGALMVSLSLVSILGILWLWHDTSDVERIAAPRAIDVLVHSSNASDVSCHAGNAAARNRFLANTCCVVTPALYLATIWTLGKFGITL